MGKISSNLITEKALRATRVDKALENFFKANGGKYTIMSPYTVPEHIAYTISPAKSSRNGSIGVSRRVFKYTPGKGIGTYTTSMYDRDINRYVTNVLNKDSGHDREMSRKHFKETSVEPTSNSAVKNSKAGNWLKNTKVGGYFTDSPLTPMNVALTHKGWTWQVNPVAYAANAYGMGSGGGYMPVGEHTVDQLRLEHGQDELNNQGTIVPINPQGTQYLDPDLGIVDTQVIKDEDGVLYYKNAQTGQFDPLDIDASKPYISADQLARNNIAKAKAKVANFNKTADYLNDIISGVIKHIPQDISKLPPLSTDTSKVANTPVQSAKPLRRVTKPPVVNNTPVTPVVNTPEVPTSNVSAPVTAPTLSSVTSQAVRHNGGFDNYRRESVLSALRAAGGISPAEAVQRGIIPWEALNYV